MSKEWKKKNKPAACTKAPWEYLIPAKNRAMIMRQIKQESIDIYGYSFNECPKRLICLKKECMGRPLPWLSPTARPYLEQLRQTQRIEDEELYIETDCQQCPLFNNCNSPCKQVNDFIHRDKAEEPILYYTGKDSRLDSVANEEKDTFGAEAANLIVGGEDIPWDCISEKKQQVIKKYLFDQLDFKYIADQLNLNNQARCKYEFYAALTKLSEYAVMRRFLRDKYDELTDTQKMMLASVYFENKTFTQVAKELQVSKQTVQQTVWRVIDKYGLKWTRFVRKKGTKLIYNVSEMFK